MWDLWWLLIPAVLVIGLAWRYRSVRMIAAITAVGAILLFPVLVRLFFNATETDPGVIRNYQLDYRVAADGRMRLKETIDVEFTENQRGIFRIFEQGDQSDPSVHHPVRVVSVQRCTSVGAPRCADEPYDTYDQDGDLVAKIGTASRVYPAGTVNRYVVTSVTENVLTQPGGSSSAQWYWNVVGEGWTIPIDRAEITAQLPAVPTQVQCITGTTDCATTTDRAVVTGTVTGIPVRTGVTWKALLPPAGLTAVPVRSADQWWHSPWLLAVGVLLAAGLALLIWRLRERRASTAPAFAEPDPDILSLAWTWREDPPNEPYQTMLLQLTQLGALTLEVQPEGQYSDEKPEWVQLTRTSEPVPDIAGAPEFLENMDLTSPGSSVRIDSDSVAVGEKVKTTEATVTNAAVTGARDRGFATASPLGYFVHLVASTCGVLSLLVLLTTRQIWPAAMLAVPAVVGIFSDRSLRTRLTDAGLAARDAVSGLRVALSTKASVERFDYSLKVRYFAQFLPWAVALDCADEWAAACKPDTPGAEADPSYQAARSSYFASHAISTAVATVSAGAAAAYAATQSSSSGGGGGGFSSGGGGGGGGGGTW